MVVKHFIPHLFGQADRAPESISNMFKTEKGGDGHWSILTSELLAGSVTESDI